MSTKVVTPKARMAFPELLEAKKDLNGREVFSVTLLIPNTADIAELKAAVEEAALAKWPKKETWQKLGIRFPFIDGNTKGKIDADGNFKTYKGYENCVVLNVKRSLKSGAPIVVGANPQNEIKDPTEIYGGRWCRAQLNAYTYDQAGNKGVTFGLNMVQILEHDEPLGTSNNPASVFGDEISTGAGNPDDFLA